MHNVSIKHPAIEISFFDSVRAAAESAANSSGGETYIALNAIKMIKIRRNTELHRNLGKITYFSDGQPVTWFAHRKSVRVPGVELWLDILEVLHQTKTHSKVLIIGAEAPVSKKCGELLQQKFEKQHFRFIDGYQTIEVYREAVVAFEPKYIFVAMGSPRQELLMAQLRQVSAAFMMGLGGSLDVFVGKTKRAPFVFRWFGVEFLYRFLTEPARIKRSFPLFEFLFLYITNGFHRKN